MRRFGCGGLRQKCLARVRHVPDTELCCSFNSRIFNMKLSIKKLPKSQIELEIEVSAEEFDNFIEQAVLGLAKDIEIKGFRKGKVPKEIVEREVGLEKILIEAANLAIKENYKKAILENKIEVISEPKVEIRKLAPGNPFVFLVRTSVLPEVKLSLIHI